MWIRKVPSYDQPTEDDEPYETYFYEAPTTEIWSPVHERLQGRQIRLPKLLYPNVERFTIGTTLTIKISRFRPTRITMVIGHCSYDKIFRPPDLSQESLCIRTNNSQVDDSNEVKDDSNGATVNYATWVIGSAIAIALLTCF